jgi:ATP-dependent Clp protease ATP-binding subunit ClpB
VDLQIKRLEELLEEKELHLVITEAARNQIAASGYDPTYGARPLKRVIQQKLQNPLASEILKGEFGPGSTVKIDFHGEDFEFSLDEARELVSAIEQ